MIAVRMVCDVCMNDIQYTDDDWKISKNRMLRLYGYEGLLENGESKLAYDLCDDCARDVLEALRALKKKKQEELHADR